MIRDRGNIKWTAMMLSEHVAELRRWQNEDHYEGRPELDDFDLQAIQYEIEVAKKRECEVQVKLWDKGKSVLYMGVIKEINVESMWITVDSPFGRDRMQVKDIISVQIAE
ncbi:YolD-like family protein [Sporosarcina sp. E16_8]|uniref:YolD-like family protein n=1 Tax=Sporosarcina sp. E16_8 TaxID=2789295 RepID=UPI001A915567|nr:YolD-like family protein [Sporosarcina sp. E16_8]MBO0587995.1 YolD-like family protein [Sporosarcina sp. E16_8]